jgi:hypothetical protein
MFSSRGAAWSLSRCSRTSCSRRFEKRFTRASVDSEDFPVSKFVVGLNGPLLTRKPGTPFILGIVSTPDHERLLAAQSYECDD